MKGKPNPSKAINHECWGLMYGAIEESIAVINTITVNGTTNFSKKLKRLINEMPLKKES